MKAIPGSLCPNEGETANLSTKFLCARELKNEEKNDLECLFPKTTRQWKSKF